MTIKSDDARGQELAEEARALQQKLHAQHGRTVAVSVIEVDGEDVRYVTPKVAGDMETLKTVRGVLWRLGDMTDAQINLIERGGKTDA